MSAYNVSSCLQQCKNYKNRVCFSRVMITNVLPRFFSGHSVYCLVVCADGVVAYNMPQGERRGPEVDLFDFTYDGKMSDTYLTGKLRAVTCMRFCYGFFPRFICEVLN